MVYQWVHADETDFSSGIFEMFLMSLICGFVMISMVLCYNGDVQPRVQSKRTQATRSSARIEMAFAVGNCCQDVSCLFVQLVANLCSH